MSDPSSDPRLRDGLSDRWLLAMLAAGLLLRVALALALDDAQQLRGDEINYSVRAEALAERGVLETGPFVRPPLYFIALAACRLAAAPFGLDWVLAARLLQCIVSVATALPLYRTARRIGGTGAARIACAVLLFDPTLIGYTHLLWPETIFLGVVAVIFDQLHGLEGRSTGRRVALGLLVGAAMLLKPVFGLFTLLLAIAWLLRLGPRPALRLALAVGGAAALVVSPWVIRNQLAYGPSIVLENQAAYNLWIGNDPRDPKLILDRWRALEDPVVRGRVARARGLGAIAEDPGGFVRRSLVRALNLWGLEFFVVRLAIIGEYGDVSRGALLGVFWVVQLAYAAKLLAAAAGVRTAARDPVLRLLLIYAGVFTLLVSAMVATTRFRVPFAFLISIAAALGVQRMASRRLARGDALALTAALLVLAFSLTRPVFRMLAFADFDAVAELDRMEWRFFRY